MLSMARRGDLPQKVAEINPVSKSPVVAVWLTGIIITLLVLSGDIRFTWSFSAFTVLIYYSITNLSAFLLPAELRLYPRIIPVLGFTGCLGLAFWIQPAIILLGLGFIALGLVWHEVVLRTGNRRVIG